MPEPLAPEQQAQSEPLSDLPAAQPYGVSHPRSASEPVVTHPPPHEQSPPPTPAPVFDSRRNRYIDPETNKIVRDPTKPQRDQPEAIVSSNGQPAPDTAEPVAIQHTPLTLNLARDFGIPEHIIAATPTADLRAEISLLQQQRAIRGQTPPPPPPAEEPIDWGINPETKLPFKEDDFDEWPLHKQMVKSHHEMKRELAEVRRKQDESERRNAQRSQQTTVDRLHELCNKHPEIFGSQSAKPGSAEAISREMMFSQLGSLVQSKRHTTLEEDFQRMMVAFGRAQQADPLPAALEGRMTPEQWQRSGLAQTAHRNTTPLPKTRRQQIADRVDDEFRRNGVKVPTGGTTGDLSDLPPR